MPADTCDQDDAAAIPQPHHLLASSLRGEHDSLKVHVDDLRMH